MDHSFTMKSMKYLNSAIGCNGIDTSYRWQLRICEQIDSQFYHNHYIIRCSREVPNLYQASSIDGVLVSGIATLIHTTAGSSVNRHLTQFNR